LEENPEAEHCLVRKLGGIFINSRCITGINQIWMADIAYFQIHHGLYPLILSAFSAKPFQRQ
jgi:hypothetical protein